MGISEAESSAPSGKLYSLQQIRWTTFLGGPFVAAWMLGHNFKQCGASHRLVIALWLIAGILSIVLMVLPHRPGSYVGPAVLITIGTFELAKRLQGAAIASHVNSGGSIQPLRQCLIVFFLCLLLTFIAAAGYVILTAKA